LLPKQLSRLLLAGLLVAIAACKKDRGSAHATLFYGMWIKGSQTGDTLYFFQSNGKNIVRYPASPNPAAPSYQEEEFGYKNGKLEFKNVLGMGDFFPLGSFAWKETGKQFEISGNDLFPFASVLMARFTFTKLP